MGWPALVSAICLAVGLTACTQVDVLMDVDPPGTPVAFAALTAVTTRAGFMEFSAKFPELCTKADVPLCHVVADFGDVRRQRVDVMDIEAAFLLPEGWVCRTQAPGKRIDGKVVEYGRSRAQVFAGPKVIFITIFGPTPTEDWKGQALKACEGLAETARSPRKAGETKDAPADAREGKAAEAQAAKSP